jgi:HK97 family phage major capsid protein
MVQLLRSEVASGYYGAYYWQPSNIEGRPATLLGYPCYNCDDIAQVGDGATQKVIAFGDFKRGYEIIDREGMYIKQLNELYITSGQIGFLATKRVTGGVVLADAIRILVEPA